MSFFDFSDAPEQTSTDLIPAKTQAKVILQLRPSKDTGSYECVSKNTGWKYLDMELTILSAPMARRKIFQMAGIGGETEGHAKSAEISRSMFRAILESARNISPKDNSDMAKAGRQIAGFEQLLGLEFAVEIGIERAKEERYQDKNKIAKVLTPDHKNYQRVMAGETITPDAPAGSAPSWQGAPPVQPAAPTPTAGAAPAWAV